jgi:drug/metabolite transporter (DMT)-like permease
VFQAVQFAVVKARARHLEPLVLMAWSQALSFVAWLLYLLLTGGAWRWPGRHWIGIGAAVVLAMGMVFLLTRASARGDISVVGPVLALSPVFAIIPDVLLSGSRPVGVLGWIGLALSIAGTMTLSRGSGRAVDLRGFFARRDVLDALGAAILLGVLSAVDRWNALALGVPGYLVTFYGATTVLVGVLTLVRWPRELRASANPRDAVAILGFAGCAVFGTGMQITAMTLAPAAYVNAMRRTSAIISVVLGRMLFDEKGLGERFVGAALTCAGAACLLLA